MKLEAFDAVLPIGARTGIEISGITADSRRVEPGFLFVALRGSRADGRAFIDDALARGAAAIVTEAGSDVARPGEVAVIEVEDARRALAQMAAIFHAGQPATVAAVTGTSGKTSVAAFLRQIWRSAGLAAASIGTTGIDAPGRSEYGSLTTPDPVELHRQLARLAGEAVTHVVMEASSHGLEQRRLDGVRLAAAGFTNLGRDHMDYHPTVEAYHAAKMRLFDTLLPRNGPAVIFADDAWSPATIAHVRASGREVRTVGEKGDFLRLESAVAEGLHQRLRLRAPSGVREVLLPLAGRFQVANSLVAAGLALSTGIAEDAVFSALAHLTGAPGRLELVGRTEAGAAAYVDYAHKPEALRSALETVRGFTRGRVIVVFGCGGDRDRGKRPLMGAIAAELADIVIVTDDNPRSEPPQAIRAEILAAAPDAIEIGDRGEAIARAVAMLGEGDTLLVAGKGHETGQIVGDRTLPFSDHEALRKALKVEAA